MSRHRLTFSKLLRRLGSDPTTYMAEYEASRDEVKETYSNLDDYDDETVLSDLAKEEGKVQEFAQMRLVELWRREHDLDILGQTVQREILHYADWEDGDDFLASVRSWRAAVAPLAITVASSALTRPASTRPASASGRPFDTAYDFVLRFLCTWLRQPVLWFFRIIFFIGAIWFLLYSALYLIGFLPIIGPIIQFLVSRLHDLISAVVVPVNPPVSTESWIPGFSLYDNFIVNRVVFPIMSIFVSDVPVENSVGAYQPPPNVTLHNAMFSAQEIANVSMKLFPLAKLVQYSSYSLISASEIVRASNVHLKDEMAKEYKILLSHTRSLTVLLGEFDNGVGALIRSFGVNLGITLARIREIITESKARYPNPVWSIASHTTTMTSVACTLLPVFRDLQPWTLAACATSYLLSSQAHCYLLATNNPSLTGAQNPLLHPVCRPIGYFRPTDLSAHQLQELHREAELLTSEFSWLVESTSKHLASLLDTSRNGIDYADAINRHYSFVSELRRRSENEAQLHSFTLAQKATYTPGLIARMGGRRAGLQPAEQYALAVFDGQWRNLKELAIVHRGANLHLQAAIEILGNINSNLGRISLDIDYYKQINRRDGNSWATLAKEMNKLKSMVEDLEELTGKRDSEERMINKLWRDRWDNCADNRLQKETELGKGWEDCLFSAESLSQLFTTTTLGEWEITLADGI
ncbi:hypothetical protein BKA61DRAFT_655128 [Leptodontidium sp. MPI-SDFR-AT-0119]|nr:hypothetical protein BKA61DRAFT_655128 [Leptodontidium sp. MPI-SDFR-AT-0119]